MYDFSPDDGCLTAVAISVTVVHRKGELIDGGEERIVVLLTPHSVRCLRDLWVEHAGPSLPALHVGAGRDVGGDFGPW